MKKITTYLAGLLLVLLSVSAFGQVNTPAGASWPFGSRIQQFPNPYPYGLIPSNLPTGAYTPASNLYGKSQDAYLAYVEWKACYVVDCGTESRVRFDNAVETVSEGIGYGMLLAAYAADRNLVEELWRYYINRRNANGLMDWRIGNGSATACGTTRNGTNAATDSEMDVAMALIVAACQWPTYTFNGTNGTPTGFGSGRTFAQEATYLIQLTRQLEINSCGTLPTYLTSSGAGFQSSCTNCFNPSYQSPGYTRLFQAFDGGAAAGFWTTNVPNASYTFLNLNRNTTTGLVSNWANGNTGVMNSCNPPGDQDHGYDAGRGPWRMGVDYIWHGTTVARTNFTQPISNWIYTKTANLTAPNNLRGPVALDGNNNGRTSAAPESFFTAMWGAATLGVDAGGNNQATLDFMYNRVRTVKQGNFGSDCSTAQTFYYGNTLRVITLFMMTGNFWKPCPPRCQAPLFTADSVSTCGPNSVLLTSGLVTGGNRTFEWFKNGTSLGAASGSANTLTVNATTPAPFGPGWFRVKVDTTGGCSQRDSIYVSSAAVKPELGSNRTLCSNTSITLNSGLYLSTGYTFTWEYAVDNVYANLQTVPGETSSTLPNVRRPGLYKVTATKTGCTTLWDTVRVSSSLISPLDNCLATAPGNVSLGITGPNLGPASQYDWYDVPTGGSVLASGTGTLTYNTANDPTPATNKPAGTYTYYVQDKSRQYGSVGKPEPTAPLPNDCYNDTPANDYTLPSNGTSPGWNHSDGNVYSQDWTVVRNINIDSVTVWYCLYNSTMPTITFLLTDATSTTTLQTAANKTGVRIINPVATYEGPAGMYRGRIQGVRYAVGFTNVAPGTYRIRVSSPVAGFNGLLEQHLTNISYNYYDNIDGNTAYIKSSFGNFVPPPTATFGSRYAHFYDWTISSPNNCARIPVIAYIGSCPAGLPLELVSFDGKAHEGYNKLTWTTATEVHTDYFLIERAGAEGVYEVIGRVEAAGNSSSILDYSYTDRSPLSEGGYYRLVQFDIDGTKYYSQSIYIGQYQSDNVTVFPNPANTQVTIRSQISDSEFTSVELIDIYGKQISLVVGSASERNIDISNLQSGIYFIRITFNGSSETIRLIKN